jgi:hypothetical protein
MIDPQTFLPCSRYSQQDPGRRFVGHHGRATGATGPTRRPGGPGGPGGKAPKHSFLNGIQHSEQPGRSAGRGPGGLLASLPAPGILQPQEAFQAVDPAGGGAGGAGPGGQEKAGRRTGCRHATLAGAGSPAGGQRKPGRRQGAASPANLEPMGIRRATVRWHLFEARKKLAGMLGGEG